MTARRLLRRLVAPGIAMTGGWWLCVSAMTDDPVVQLMAAGCVIVGAADAMFLLPWDEKRGI